MIVRQITADRYLFEVVDTQRSTAPQAMIAPGKSNATDSGWRRHEPNSPPKRVANDLPNVRSSFGAFPAKGFDGSSPVNYQVELFGEVMDDGNFSPAEGDITTIEWKTFNMIHSGGPGRRVACTGLGTLPTFTETVVTGTTS